MLGLRDLGLKASAVSMFHKTAGVQRHDSVLSCRARERCGVGGYSWLLISKS